jgi:drug/metabolite transporter (DMT)-like permease
MAGARCDGPSPTVIGDGELPARQKVKRLDNWQLFAVCVGVWSTTWYAITFQIGYTPPEVGVAMRFGVAGLLVLAWCALRGLPLRFRVHEHGRLLLQGGFMYGVSYVCVYHAEKYLVSGLVAVGFSASPLVTALGARIFFGQPLSRRFLAGGVLGMLGVATIFWPELARASANDSAALGALFTMAAVGLSTVGSLTASRNKIHGMSFWPSLGWGMTYGGLAGAAAALLQGQSFALPAAASWWFALLYLSLAGSILTFACFLTLQNRVGPGPTATIGVMTPLLALVVSLLLENYRPDLLSLLGAVLAVIGNVFMLQIKVPSKTTLVAT